MVSMSLHCCKNEMNQAVAAALQGEKSLYKAKIVFHTSVKLESYTA